MSAELDIVSVDEALLRFLVAARKTEPSSSSTTRRLILEPRFGCSPKRDTSRARCE